MKIVYQLMFVVLLAGIQYSCSNEFEVTEPGEPLPVVYGLLEANKDVNYIRIEKSFVSEDQSAYVLAKDPNQLYYDNIEVRLTHIKLGKDINSVVLERVNGDDVGIPRDTGVFAQSPNYLYMFRTSQFPLNPRDTFRLSIHNQDGTLLTDSYTRVLTPYKNGDLASPGPTASLSFKYTTVFNAAWIAEDLAALHDFRLIFDITESAPGVPDKDVEFSWTIGKNLAKPQLSVSGRSFFEIMGTSFEKKPNTTRKINNISIELSSGGKEIKEYIDIVQANLGITSSGEIPTYSNLSNEALGLFSSKTVFKREGVLLTNETRDSLRSGIYTKDLNFTF